MTIAEFWKERYDVVVAEKKALGDKLRETLDKNNDLQLQLDRLKDRLTYSALKNMEMEIGRLKESLEGAIVSRKNLMLLMPRRRIFRHASTILGRRTKPLEA